MGNVKTDVVIVGAGLSGLIAARHLMKHNLSVQIVEAQRQVGGRIVDFTSISGHTFSLGGDWFGTGESRFRHWLAELELEAEPVPPSPGKTMVRLLGQTQICKDEQGLWFPPLSLPSDVVGAELVQAFEKIASMAGQLSTTAPHLAPAEWDDLTLESWSQQHISDEQQRKLFEIVVKEETGQELRDTSLLYYLFVYQSTVSKLEDDHVIKGGPLCLIEALAKPLKSNIHLDRPVHQITQTDKGVELIAGPDTFVADYVIVAISPAVANQITYQPALPEKQQQLYTHTKMGQIIKCVVTYRSPFWYEQGLSGAIISDEGPLECTLDVTFMANGGALLGYMMGDEARKWSQRSRSERRAAVIEQLVVFLGPEADANRVLEYSEVNWPQNQWIKGAYYASPAPGAMVAYGETIAQPFGRIHWAGTETAEDWCGTMEGAVLAGERAAQEILFIIKKGN